jgi:hypothetical protein
MTHQIVLRDVARIILPFSIFIGLFAQGVASGAGFVVGVFCVWYAIKHRLRNARSADEFGRA